MKYGYARVSTDDQNPALQLAALKKAGCKTVFKDEGLSGATTKRPALLRCLKKLEGATRSLCGNSTGWAAACAA
jgi:DNA invertase Pin-like site-specific DNA recombinase